MRPHARAVRNHEPQSIRHSRFTQRVEFRVIHTKHTACAPVLGVCSHRHCDRPPTVIPFTARTRSMQPRTASHRPSARITQRQTRQGTYAHAGQLELQTPVSGAGCRAASSKRGPHFWGATLSHELATPRAPARSISLGPIGLSLNRPWPNQPWRLASIGLWTRRAEQRRQKQPQRPDAKLESAERPEDAQRTCVRYACHV